MFAIRLIPPYGREHFGGSVGIVDWGSYGENVLEFEDGSNTATSIKANPGVYRVVQVSLPVPELAPDVVHPAPPPPPDEDDESSWEDIKAQAKELGIGIYGKKKAELEAEIDNALAVE